jgi:LmbE family N-acetylglucosaminyl deacetylase
VFGANETRATEARASASAFLSAAAHASVTVHSFRDGFFPDEFSRLKEKFESLKREVNPDVIFSHVRNDHHQDHRMIADLTWNTFREHLILGYEVIKYDSDLGNPNVLVPLEATIAQSKVSTLMQHFQSQLGRRWFVPETFLAMMRVRGVHAAAASGFAEAFYGPKLWL